MSYLDDYTLSHVFEHLLDGYTPERWDRSCQRIEERRLLARQAQRSQGFAKATEDLERYFLPATIQAGDWDRFLQYSLTAINLRGLAEALADEDILGALARSGRIRLAENLAAQLPTSEQRAWAWAVLAEASPRAERTERVRQELRDLRAANDPQLRERRVDLLAGIARRLGPELLGDWRDLCRRDEITTAARDRLWWEIAAACLRAGGADHSGFRMALQEISSPESRRVGLPALWREHGPDDPAAARALAAELGDPQALLFWDLALPKLARRAETDPEGAIANWRREAAAGPPVPWSERLIDAGGKLFGRLEQEETEGIAAGLSEPLLRAAFRVVRLEHGRAPGLTEPAIEALRELAEPVDRLRWTLRALLAWSDDARVRQGYVASVMRHLTDRRWSAPVEDLCRYVDLVAAVFPGEVGRQIESVVWSPQCRPETLLALAEQTTSGLVLEHLAKNAESFAAVVGPTEAEGFELRATVLAAAACRLAVRQGSLAAIDAALARLLDEEQDTLCVATARALAAAGQAELAGKLADRIHSSRLRLATQLAVGSGQEQEEQLEPERLYATAATAEAVEDERLALAALAEPALDAEQLIERHLVAMRNKERQGRALVDLAHHAQTFELTFYRGGQQDPLAPLQLLRSSLTGTGSDDRLLALALELVELAAPLPVRRALAEIQAALDAILKLEDLSWAQRIEAIETLLARLVPVLFGSRMPGDPWVRRRARALRGFLQSLAELPARTSAVADPGGLRQHWIEIPPILAATAERLPVQALGRWTAKLALPWEGIGAGQEEILRLCVASPAERREMADRLVTETSSDPVLVQALCHLVSCSAPERVPVLAGLLPLGPLRDRLCLRLARNGWLPPEETAKLFPMIQDPFVRLRAAVGGPASREEDLGGAWLADLASLVAQGELEPTDPASWPVLRRLWRTRTGEERQSLARAVTLALRERGRRAGEDALCTWLNAHLAPRIGGDVPDREARDRRVRAALARGLALVVPAAPPEGG